MPLVNAAKVFEDREFKPTPEGRYTAICTGIYDIGTQAGTWEGKPNHRQKVVFTFEMYGQDAQGEPTLVMEDGRPYWGRKIYTLSLDKKATLRKDLSSWRGKPITDEEVPNAPDLIKSFLGKPCEIVVSHEKWKDGSGKVSEVLGQITPPHPKTTIPKRVNELRFFDIGNWEEAVFQELPEWIKKKIESSPEFKDRGAFISPQQSTAHMTPARLPAGGFSAASQKKLNPNGLPAIEEDSLDDLIEPLSDDSPF